MSNIFINGLSAKSAGGKSILINYLKELKSYQTNNNYIILVHKTLFISEYEGKHIHFIHLPNLFENKLFFPLVYSIIIPRLLKINKIDLVFNLADIPIKTRINQLFLFDWSYAVYPKSKVWNLMSKSDFILKKIKLYYFKKFSRYINVLIAQTDTMKNHLKDQYKIDEIYVVPNAVSLDNLKGGVNIDYKLPIGHKFLYLTHYYPHKNIEIFLEIAKQIMLKGLNYKLIITIEPDQHIGAKQFLDEVIRLKLDKIIVNVGAVKMENVPSLYKQCDALLMPTLLESFSGTYVEAMFHKKPILTSNYDFAVDICQEAAIYFDPYNAIDILQKMENLFIDESKMENLVSKGNKVLSRLPGWDKTFKMYNSIMKNLI